VQSRPEEQNQGDLSPMDQCQGFLVEFPLLGGHLLMPYFRWIEDNMTTNLGPCGIDSRTGEPSDTPGDPGFSLADFGRGLACDSRPTSRTDSELLDSWMAIIYLPC